MTGFPTVKDLAEAQEDQVLKLWSGLGYYSRARNLQKGARYLMENHKGKFPQTRDEVLCIPGIGPYTAGAVLSIAFDLAVPIVDGNVMRVFARVYGFLAKEKKMSFEEMMKELRDERDRE
jgi:A/G-specific adenine glycosylase